MCNFCELNSGLLIVELYAVKGFFKRDKLSGEIFLIFCKLMMVSLLYLSFKS